MDIVACTSLTVCHPETAFQSSWKEAFTSDSSPKARRVLEVVPEKTDPVLSNKESATPPPYDLGCGGVSWAGTPRIEHMSDDRGYGMTTVNIEIHVHRPSTRA